MHSRGTTDKAVEVSMSENGVASRKTWEEVRRIACEIADGMNEEGSEFTYECRPAPVAGDGKNEFVVSKKEARDGGRVVPIALFSYERESTITIQVKPTGYIRTYQLKANGDIADFRGSIYDLVDEVMFQLPQVPV